MQPDDEEALPPITVEPTSAPFDVPTTHKKCLDCARGVEAPGITYPRDPLRPIAEFEQKRAARYKDSKRYVAYCTPHAAQRNRDYLARRRANAPPAPPGRRKLAEQASIARTEQRPERIAKKRENARAWRLRNPEREAARNTAWAQEHKERRKKTKAESAARRKRGEYVRPPRPSIPPEDEG